MDNLVLVAIFAIAGLVLIGASVTIVPQGFAYTVENFGRYTRTLNPGLHFIMPIYQRVGRKMNMMETVLDIPTQEVITRDNASIKADGVVFFQVQDAALAAYEVQDLTNAWSARWIWMRCFPIEMTSMPGFCQWSMQRRILGA